MRTQYVAGNWKLNGNLKSNHSLIEGIMEANQSNLAVKCIVFPPAIYLPQIANLCQDSAIQYGAQNIYPESNGAYTGEISVDMIKEFGGRYVLVGHSERRHIFKEDEKFIANKFHHIKEHDMIPILCIGETLEEYQQGRTEDIIEQQLRSVVRDANTFNDCVIAYEPVWAIGTGHTASPELAQSVHLFIRSVLSNINESSAVTTSILYGGSVNAQNASLLFSMPDIDGGLVGGASLDANKFVEIIKCIS